MYCARHPERDAPWECLRCQTLHCEECVRRVEIGKGQGRFASACSHCDGLLRRAAEIVPSEREEQRTLALLPLSPVGLRTTSVVAVLGAGSDIPFPVIDLAFGALYLTALAGTAWHLVEHVARGRPGFPAPVEASGPSPLEQAKAGLTCVLALFFPFGIWWGAHRGAETVGEVFAAHPSQAAFLIALVAVYGPAAILASVVYGGALGAMWPPGWVRVAVRTGRLYLEVTGRLALAAVAFWALRWLAALALGRVPVLGSFAVSALGTLIVFAAAASIGGFLRRHRDEMGFVF